LLASTETCLHPTNKSTEIFDAIPHGFSFVSKPHLAPPTCTPSVFRGGTPFLIRDPCTLPFSPTAVLKSFEMSTITLELAQSKLTVHKMYHPLSSSANSRDTSYFSQFTENFCLTTSEFNVHVHVPSY
jgi:hypothetical protein